MHGQVVLVCLESNERPSSKSDIPFSDDGRKRKGWCRLWLYLPSQQNTPEVNVPAWFGRRPCFPTKPARKTKGNFISKRAKGEHLHRRRSHHISTGQRSGKSKAESDLKGFFPKEKMCCPPSPTESSAKPRCEIPVYSPYLEFCNKNTTDYKCKLPNALKGIHQLLKWLSYSQQTLKNTVKKKIILWWCANNPCSSKKIRLPSSLMDNGKKPFSTILCSEPNPTNASQAQHIPTNNCVTHNISPSSSKDGNTAKLGNPKAKVISGRNNQGTPEVRSNSLFSKLTKIRAKAQKLKENTLMGYVIGNPIEFPKLFAKLKSDWRYLKGEINFFDGNYGWFEIIFANPIDLKRIWEGRPYHVFGQLLLFKKWFIGFIPQTESYAQLDLWIRIPQLPAELCSAEAISLILEENHIGTLIKLDPNTNQRKWAKFVRICTNIDFNNTIENFVMIPNAEGIEEKFNIWFEDWPEGCGNCGEISHLFSSCPLRKFTPPKFQISIRRADNPNKTEMGENEAKPNNGAEWVEINSKKNTKKHQEGFESHGTKPYLNKNGGLTIVYEDSPPNQSSSNKPVFTFSAAQTTSSTKASPTKTTIKYPNQVHHEPGPLNKPSSSTAPIENTLAQQSGVTPIIIASTNSPTFAPSTIVQSSDPQNYDENVNAPQDTNPTMINKPNNANTILLDNFPDEESKNMEIPNDDDDEKLGSDSTPVEDGLMEPKGGKLDEYTNAELIMEEDDLLDEEEEEDYSIKDDDEEQIFTKEEMIDMINSEPEKEDEKEAFSGDSYHSLNSANSKNSSSSMINKLNTMQVHNSAISTSGSSKRKLQGGEDDTASSVLMGSKKPKF